LVLEKGGGGGAMDHAQFGGGGEQVQHGDGDADWLQQGLSHIQAHRQPKGKLYYSVYFLFYFRIII